MKVVVLSQWLPRPMEGTSGGLGRSLSRRGAHITYVAGNHLNPDWSVPPGPRFRVTRQDVDGISVRRYPYYRSHDRSIPRRIATYATFSATSTALGLNTLRKADVILVNSTPATVATAAITARRLFGTPYVLLVQDVWPDSLFDSGFVTDGTVARLVRPPTEFFVRSAYGNARLVLGISPAMRDLLIDRGCDPERTSYVYNWADESALPSPVPPNPRGPDETFHLMYAGNLGTAQDLSNVLRAIALLPRDTVRLTLVGTGAEQGKLESLARELGLGNVTFHPRVSRLELIPLMAGAHAHIIPLADSPIFRVTVPSKLQFACAAGVPVLCCSPGQAADMVSRSGAGMACTPGDPEALAATIRRMRNVPDATRLQMGVRAREFYDRELSERANGDRLYELLANAAR